MAHVADQPPTDCKAKIVDFHQQYLAHGRHMLEAAALAGKFLLDQRKHCRETAVSFRTWCDRNLPFSYSTANRYMAVFRNWRFLSDVMRQLPEQDAGLSIREALRILRRQGNRRPTSATFQMPRNRVASAVRLLSRLHPQELLQVADSLRNRLEGHAAQTLEKARQTLRDTQTLVAALQSIDTTTATQLLAGIQSIRASFPDMFPQLEEPMHAQHPDEAGHEAPGEHLRQGPPAKADAEHSQPRAAQAEHGQPRHAQTANKPRQDEQPQAAHHPEPPAPAHARETAHARQPAHARETAHAREMSAVPTPAHAREIPPAPTSAHARQPAHAREIPQHASGGRNAADSAPSFTPPRAVTPNLKRHSTPDTAHASPATHPEPGTAPNPGRRQTATTSGPAT